MTNKRNVEALTALLEAVGETKGSARIVAEFLAVRGVLVPSALTDEECQLAAEDTQAAEAFDRSTARYHDDFRAVLESIAKGEGGP